MRGRRDFEENVCELRGPTLPVKRFAGRPLFSADDGEVTDRNCAAIDCPKVWPFEVVRQEVPRGLRRELGDQLYVVSPSADPRVLAGVIETIFIRCDLTK